MHETTIARKLDALTSEVREVRRLVTKLANAQASAQRQPEQVTRTPDGGMFLPGTGTIGQRTLSDEARAALDALEQTNDHQPAPPAPERTHS